MVPRSFWMCLYPSSTPSAPVSKRTTRPSVDVLAELRRELLERLPDRRALERQRRDVGLAVAGDELRERGDGAGEVGALGDEVGVAVELDDHADVAVDEYLDRALRRPRARRACRPCRGPSPAASPSPCRRRRRRRSAPSCSPSSRRRSPCAARRRPWAEMSAIGRALLSFSVVGRRPGAASAAAATPGASAGRRRAPLRPRPRQPRAWACSALRAPPAPRACSAFGAGGAGFGFGGGRCRSPFFLPEPLPLDHRVGDDAAHEVARSGWRRRCRGSRSR